MIIRRLYYGLWQFLFVGMSYKKQIISEGEILKELDSELWLLVNDGLNEKLESFKKKYNDIGIEFMLRKLDNSKYEDGFSGYKIGMEIDLISLQKHIQNLQGS